MKNKKTILILIILILVWFGIQALIEKPTDDSISNDQTMTQEEMAEVESFDQDVQVVAEEEANFEGEITELESLSF